MIQPIGAFSPRADLRGHGVAFRRTPQERSKAQTALINATGFSVVVGAFTTAISRSYTSSWAHAGVLGVFATLLLMSLITPISVEKNTLLGKMSLGTLPKDSTKPQVAPKLKPVKKLVQFKQS